MAAEPKSIESAIRCGGLAPKKAVCIKNILNRLQNERGSLCLEYLRCLSVEEVKTELSHFKGVGPKTVNAPLFKRNNFKNLLLMLIATVIHIVLLTPNVVPI